MADDNEVPVEIVDELPSPLEDAHTVIAGVRAEEAVLTVPGSEAVECAACGADVMLAPSGLAAVERYGWPVGCLQCAADAMEADDE